MASLREYLGRFAKAKNGPASPSNHLPMVATELSPQRESEMIAWLAEKIKRFRMETPAIVFLQTLKPTATIMGELGIAFLAPYAELFGVRGNDWALLIRRKENVERLIRMLEGSSDKIDANVPI